jgi:recombination protein RecR
LEGVRLETTDVSNAPLTGPLQRLMDELKKLPGIGARSAERLAFHILKADREEAVALAEAIMSTKDEIRPCSRCYNLAEGELCDICKDPRRDQGQVVVVEQPKDLMALEATGVITGVYHVLMGHIAPLEGVEPSDLTIDALVKRVKSGEVREVILATNPTVEGDATALHITSLLADTGVQITRLASSQTAPCSKRRFAAAGRPEGAGRREPRGGRNSRTPGLTGPPCGVRYCWVDCKASAAARRSRARMIRSWAMPPICATFILSRMCWRVASTQLGFSIRATRASACIEL